MNCGHLLDAHPRDAGVYAPRRRITNPSQLLGNAAPLFT
jgi:hypothetical protein